MSALAWLEATSPDARWRNAEAGPFTDAVRPAEAALAVAGADSELGQDIRRRLALSESRTPYRLP